MAAPSRLCTSMDSGTAAISNLHSRTLTHPPSSREEEKSPPVTSRPEIWFGFHAPRKWRQVGGIRLVTSSETRD